MCNLIQLVYCVLYLIFSGLICGHEFAKVFPLMRKNVVIVSSIFFASRKVNVAKLTP